MTAITASLADGEEICHQPSEVIMPLIYFCQAREHILESLAKQFKGMDVKSHPLILNQIYGADKTFR